MIVENIREKLLDVGYSSNDTIDNALRISLALEKPLLIEGDPGVGKSSLAKAVADALGFDFIRVQLYDGLTDDKLIYDYNYQKQLLTLEAIKPFIIDKYKNNNINDIIEKVSHELNFYGKEFLIDRPILRSITGEGRKVILFDEIDKAPEEIEYMLYEFLENYSITIPEYGEIKCPEDMKPIVFLTSNNYRELSDALRRRCNYLYIESKTKEEIIEILKAKVNIDDEVAQNIAKIIYETNTKDLGIKQPPSIGEAIEWAKYINTSDIKSSKDISETLTIIAKNYKDYLTIKERYFK